MRNNYKEYYGYIHDFHDKKIELYDKYNKEYVKRVFNYLPDKYKDNAIDFINSDDTLIDFCSKNECGGLFSFIPNFDDMSFYYPFTTKLENRLNDLDVSSDEKKQIRKYRIMSFKSMGIDRGRDYSNYVDLVGDLVSFETADEFEMIHNQVVDDYYRELKLNIFPTKEIYKEAQEIGLEWDVLKRLPVNKMGCFSSQPNFVMRDNELLLYPVITIDGGDEKNYTDEWIIHEMEHALEMVLLETNEEETIVKSGFELLKFNNFLEKTGRISEEDTKCRDYERFNEVIHELISWDIFDIFKNLKGSVFSDLEDTSLNYSDYLDQGYIVKEFYDTYKSLIIQSKRGNNLNVLFNAIGEENFEVLNSLIKEDFEMIDHEELEEDLILGKDTEYTRRYNDIIDRRNVVLESMKNYYSTRCGSTVKY